MRNHEYVVRIVQPAAEPKPLDLPRLPRWNSGQVRSAQVSRGKPQKVEFTPMELVEGEEEGLFQKILGGVGVAAVAALGIFLVINFSNLGISVKEILVLVGIPLVLGIAASYTFF